MTDELLIAMVHHFKERGSDGNLPPARCLACGLLRKHPVHGAAAVSRQNDLDMSYIAGAILNWKGPGQCT